MMTPLLVMTKNKTKTVLQSFCTEGQREESTAGHKTKNSYEKNCSGVGTRRTVNTQKS